MAFTETEVGIGASFQEKWCIFSSIKSRMYIMVRHSHGVINYAPLYVHSFIFFQPHFLVDAGKFNIAHPDSSQLTTMADKLRHYRYKMALLQREVAEYVGIKRATYSSYEENIRDYCPIDILERIAELFEVGISDLLDDYNAFLYNGQAEQLKDLRKQLGLTQKVFAEQLGVSTTTYARWEQGKMRMTKKTWGKVFDR